MAIVVSCQCGKRFKVKDRLAGKAVRCPSCRNSLRIPGATKKGGGSSAAPKVDKEAALRRFEEAQRRKQETAEAEAAYRDEQGKLIESYDQLVGKTGQDKKHKHALAGEKPRKVTIFTLIADAWGIIKGNLFFKYLVVVVLLGGGSVGSVFLVRHVATYMGDETAAPELAKDERWQALFEEAKEEIRNGNPYAATKALNELELLNPNKRRRDIKEMRKQIDELLLNKKGAGEGARGRS